MNHWETMVDGTSFGLIAAYLRSPNSPIDFILHVKDRTMLADVAGCIERDFLAGIPPWPPLSPGLQGLIRDGAVKVSCRMSPGQLPPGAVVDDTQVRASAYAEVIYLPPFYLAHTPGLFEGKMLRDRPREHDRTRASTIASREPTAQPRKDRDQGHQY